MMRTTEDLWAVSNTASPAARLNIRADQLIKCGTEVVAKSVVVDAQDRPSGEDDIPYPWRPKGRTASMDAPERSEDDIPF